MRTVIAERVRHDSGIRVTLRFPWDEDLVAIVRSIPSARWSKRLECWHMADCEDLIGMLLKAFHKKAFINYEALKKVTVFEKVKKVRDNRNIRSRLSPINEYIASEIERFRRWMEAHRYPESTVNIYSTMMTIFLRFVYPKKASECTSEDLDNMIQEYIISNGLSYSFQNQMISAVKKFYRQVYGTVMDIDRVSRPRPQHRLPNVLSKEEVKKVLEAPLNEKHRVILSLVYACGLRRSELLALLPTDFDRDRKLLHIRQSKGFKDRIVPLSERILEMIDRYVIKYKPVRYVFEGQWPGSRYSESSIEKVFRTACEGAGIKKSITLHGLRHSYATHLLEAGTDLRYIQELLGHKSSKTTEIYTHVTDKSIQRIRTPFDDL